MPDPHETRAQRLRINNLEQQVHIIQGELQIFHDGILQKSDIEKLVNLKEKLKKLNDMLIELRTYYNSMQEATQKRKKHASDLTKQVTQNNTEHPTANTDSFKNSQQNNIFVRENAGFDHTESFTQPPGTAVRDKPTARHNEASKGSDPFKTCKQLMEEIKPPGSILGKYLTTLQDFRADPELRRQRWEKKQQQKLQQKHLKNPPSVEDKSTTTEEPNKYAKCLPSRPWKSSTMHGINLADRSNSNPCSSRYGETDSVSSLQMTVINKNLSKTIEKLLSGVNKRYIVLTLVLEGKLYHLSVSQITNGQQLACFLVTEEAVQEAKQQSLFQDFLTFFLVSAENSKSQKDRVLGHLFEFIKTDSETDIDDIRSFP